MTENDDPWLTIAEVAEELRISKMTVYRMLSTGQLRSMRMSRLYRVRRSWLDEYLAAHTS